MICQIGKSQPQKINRKKRFFRKGKTLGIKNTHPCKAHVSNTNQNKNFPISKPPLHSESTEMGCGESKHVATGNTISRKNSRAGSRRGKTPDAIDETSKLDRNTSSLVKEEGKNTVADGKDTAESTELKKLEGNAEDGKEKKNGVVKQNDEPVETIAFEGISGRSEYFSPREEAGDESLGNENVIKAANALEDKKLSGETNTQTVQEIKFAEETQETAMEDPKVMEEAKEETVKEVKELAEEKKEETGNGEPEGVKEENLVKETETGAKVSTPVQKEEENPNGSPAEELKTE